MAAIEPRPEQRPHPFNPEASDKPAPIPVPKPWSFSQPVLLKKTNRNRTVLVWSLRAAWPLPASGRRRRWKPWPYRANCSRSRGARHRSVGARRGGGGAAQDGQA